MTDDHDASTAYIKALATERQYVRLAALTKLPSAEPSPWPLAVQERTAAHYATRADEARTRRIDAEQRLTAETQWDTDLEARAWAVVAEHEYETLLRAGEVRFDRTLYDDNAAADAGARRLRIRAARDGLLCKQTPEDWGSHLFEPPYPVVEVQRPPKYLDTSDGPLGMQQLGLTGTVYTVTITAYGRVATRHITAETSEDAKMQALEAIGFAIEVAPPYPDLDWNDVYTVTVTAFGVVSRRPETAETADEATLKALEDSGFTIKVAPDDTEERREWERGY